MLANVQNSYTKKLLQKTQTCPITRTLREILHLQPNRIRSEKRISSISKTFDERCSGTLLHICSQCLEKNHIFSFYPLSPPGLLLPRCVTHLLLTSLCPSIQNNALTHSVIWQRGVTRLFGGSQRKGWADFRRHQENEFFFLFI